MASFHSPSALRVVWGDGRDGSVVSLKDYRKDLGDEDLSHMGWDVISQAFISLLLLLLGLEPRPFCKAGKHHAPELHAQPLLSSRKRQLW